MSETATTETVEETKTEEKTEDQRVPYERFEKVNKQAKEAKDKAAAAEKRTAELEAQIAEREASGLPELEQLKKRLEKAEQDAEKRVTDAVEQTKTRAKAERMVLAAASRAGFDDPDDVFRFPEHVDVESIEDADQADRAVKQLAKAKPRLLKDTEVELPGKVLSNGKATTQKAKGGIDLDAEAQMIADNLKTFLANRGK